MTLNDPKSIEELRDQFLLRVGECITEWANLEEELFNICHHLLGCGLEKSSIVYLRSPTLETRLSLIDELMEATFPKVRKNGGKDPPELKAWADILTEIRKHTQTRNRIAHSPVAPEYLKPKGGWMRISRGDIWYESQPHPHETVRGTIPPKGSLKIFDLKKHARTVQKVWQQLGAFRSRTLKAPRAVRTVPPKMRSMALD